MTRRFIDRKHEIAYEDGADWMAARVTLDGHVKIESTLFGPLCLTLAQARKFAERILSWCDEAEAKKGES